MAQNVTVAGASYSNVPSVELPKTGGGTASFIDVSDTTAAASDVAAGKYFYTAQGVRTVGTGSGGGGNFGLTELWRNNSPTSNMSADTNITLNDDLRNYAIIMIGTYFSTTTKDISFQSYPVSYILDAASDNLECSLRINAGSYNRTGVRNFMTSGYTHIVFAGANYNASSNNSYVIPVVIFGVSGNLPDANGEDF